MTDAQKDIWQAFVSCASYNKDQLACLADQLRELFQNYPNEISFKLVAFNEIHYVELIVVVKVVRHYSRLNVDLRFLFTNKFPFQAPFVRIVNHKPNRLQHEPFYTECQSTNDPTSYFLASKLQTLQRWVATSRVNDVIKQSIHLFARIFPFISIEEIRKIEENKLEFVAEVKNLVGKAREDYAATVSEVQNLAAVKQSLRQSYNEILSKNDDIARIVKQISSRESKGLYQCVRVDDGSNQSIEQLESAFLAYKDLISSIEEALLEGTLPFDQCLHSFRKYQAIKFQLNAQIHKH